MNNETATKNPGKQFEQKVGAMWNKVASNGTEYLSGEITVNGEKKQFVAFNNKNKNKDTHPDLEIFWKRTQVSQGVVPQNAKKPVTKQPVEPVQEEEEPIL